METVRHLREFNTFSPALQAEDGVANYWMRQVTVRLRREICWRWHQQEGSPESVVTVPAIADPLITSLDLSRYWQEKCQFYQTDPTAKYLTDKLISPPPVMDHPARGGLAWVIATLGLEDVAAFVLALGLIARFDHAAGAVIATCLNDAVATQPTLALAQQLWDCPEQVLAIADPGYPLWRYGLLQSGNPAVAAGTDWQSPIVLAPCVATCLLFPDSPLPQVLVALADSQGERPLPRQASLVAARLQGKTHATLQIVPVRGTSDTSAREIVQGIARITQTPVVELQVNSTLLDDTVYLKSLITCCWLRGLNLFILGSAITAQGNHSHPPHAYLLPLQFIPIAIFMGIADSSALTSIPTHLLQPIVEVPRLSYSDRIAYWQHCLAIQDATLTSAIAECSRRFRYEKETIQAICSGLTQRPQPLCEADLFAACRAELDLDISELAQKVEPRFSSQDLVLPPRQQVLFQEIYRAMTALTEVHYGWGTAQAWNESGISVLFAGPPGTGKTMAAEILAVQLDLPMYRIDLSQVVNKYIGETEKNLKRLFDRADISDTILFFDEADALFGRRTEVKDAHDRYANLEISYLLERMERFKGLAILATNRKKDLDEAFLRRLRYILDFPLPDTPERKRIWLQVIPTQVDTSQLDFDFLARQFPLAGGHIRSIVFNACLQSAAGSRSGEIGTRSQLTMERVMVAVKREYDKLNRSINLEQFGPYAKLVEGKDYE